eukprot:1670612-Alexandrium_andersonii.AAC.1
MGIGYLARPTPGFGVAHCGGECHGRAWSSGSRPPAPGRALRGPAGPGVGPLGLEGRACSVSYTHLTLPTICSV